jgi:hypothetical protein
MFRRWIEFFSNSDNVSDNAGDDVWVGVRHDKVVAHSLCSSGDKDSPYEIRIWLEDTQHPENLIKIRFADRHECESRYKNFVKELKRNPEAELGEDFADALLSVKRENAS